MRKFSRLLAILILAGVLMTWGLLGAHAGWSQTQVPIRKIDPVTEIEFTEYERRFVPGIDFLGAGVASALAIFAIGFLFSKTPPK